MKNRLRQVLSHLPIGVRLRVAHAYKFHRIPSLASPRTFNEKIAFRKARWKNNLFVTCSDKHEAKAYVAKAAGDAFVTQSVYVGGFISAAIIRSALNEFGRVVIKTTHGSGSVYFADSTATEADLIAISEKIARDLRVDYGKLSGESWYSAIEPRVIVEPNIALPGVSIVDYKFHVFSAGDEQRFVLQVDYDRSSDHSRSFFDESGEFLDFGLCYPVGRRHLGEHVRLTEMAAYARRLAAPFSYARVDLYQTDSDLRFGELTFAHGSGLERFSPPSRDLWMGSLWTGSPSY